MASQRMDPSPQTEQVLGGRPKVFTPLQHAFLHRIDDLVKKREAFIAEERPDPLLKKMLARALYTAMLDCTNEGVGAEAQAILDQVRQTKS